MSKRRPCPTRSKPCRKEEPSDAHDACVELTSLCLYFFCIRCLDVDYLILKTFLLERFLHDFIFESRSPNTVREFLGVL